MRSFNRHISELTPLIRINLICRDTCSLQDEWMTDFKIHSHPGFFLNFQLNIWWKPYWFWTLILLQFYMNWIKICKIVTPAGIMTRCPIVDDFRNWMIQAAWCLREDRNWRIEDLTGTACEYVLPKQVLGFIKSSWCDQQDTQFPLFFFLPLAKHKINNRNSTRIT